MSNPHISVVIPIYRCSTTIEELAQRLSQSLETINLNFEIIFVNDASPENDWQLILSLGEKDRRIKALSLSRNFGQHYAITAGLHHSKGDWVVVMDGDLEDRPEDILLLYKQAQEGFDIVYADYETNTKPFLVRICSAIYHKIFNFLADNSANKGNARFVLLRRSVVDVYNQLQDRKRHFGPLLHTIGFKDYKLRITPQKVTHQSSYTFWKKFNLAITSIIAHSTILLRLSIVIGFIFSITAFLFTFYIIGRKISGFPVELGWSSLMASIYFVSGLIMILIGILGMYIEAIIHEVKKTPLYIVRDQINFEE